MRRNAEKVWTGRVKKWCGVVGIIISVALSAGQTTQNFPPGSLRGPVGPQGGDPRLHVTVVRKFSGPDPLMAAISEDGEKIAVICERPSGATVYWAAEKPPASWPWFKDGAGGDYPFHKKRTRISTDGKRLAFVGTEEHQDAVVLDGKMQKKYPAVDELHFSADSKHVVYVARTADNKILLVKDGVETSTPFGATGGFDESLGTVRVSKDGLHVAVVGRLADVNRRAVWVDGKLWSGHYEINTSLIEHIDQICMSPDGKRVAVVGRVIPEAELKQGFNTGGPATVQVIENDVAGKAYARLLIEQHTIYEDMPVTFSPDSAHLMYLAADDQQAYVVDNGKEVAKGEWFGGPITFSPDGRHYTYYGEVARKLVSPGAAGQPGSGLVPIGEKPRTGETVVFFDGKPGKGLGNPVIFSADSKHWAYVTSRMVQVSVPGTRQTGFQQQYGLVIDDRTPMPTADGQFLQFSPDGRHVASVAYAEFGDPRPLLMINGVAMRYPLEGRFVKLRFEGPNRLHGITVNAQNEYRWVDIQVALPN